MAACIGILGNLFKKEQVMKAKLKKKCYFSVNLKKVLKIAEKSAK